MVIDRLGWAESTWAGLLGQLGADEGQRLLGHIIRQLSGLPRGLSEVPPVGEQVVQTDLQSLGAGSRPERAAIGAFEDSRLLERGLQPGCRIAVGANGVVFDVVSGPATWWRLVGEQTGEDTVHPDQMVDQLAHRPVRTRGRR